MTAHEFLDVTRARRLRIAFPGVTIYDSFSGLLDVSFAECMSDSPNIAIGELVVPELTLTFSHIDLAAQRGQPGTLDVLLEQSRMDISAAVQRIQRQTGSRSLAICQGSNGCWFAADGRRLYSCWQDANGAMHLDLVLIASRDIAAIWLDETRVDISSDGLVRNNYGRVILLHTDAPHQTWAAFQGSFGGVDNVYTGFRIDGEEHEETDADPLQAAVLADAATARIGMTRSTLCHLGTPFGERITETVVQSSAVYVDGALCRTAFGGQCIIYEPSSYGEITLTESSATDEETTEAVCHGILHKLTALHIGGTSGFLRTYLRGAATMADLYSSFLYYLRQEHGISLTAAEQTLADLAALPVVVPDWTTFDDTGLTAGQLLREFALLEGGNARIDRDGKLRLGWCETEPSLVISEEVLGRLRVETERLAPATGIAGLYNEASENVIETSTDELTLAPLTDAAALENVWRTIVARFSPAGHLPFAADLLRGASPLLRVGDCVTAVTRSGAALDVQVLSQEVGQFPALRAALSTPDGTDWTTEPVDYASAKIVHINVTPWPRFLLDDEPPDLSGSVVTAVRMHGARFTVDPAICVVTRGTPLPNGLAPVTVTFAHCSEQTYLPVYHALTTADGTPIVLANGDKIAVKEAN